MTKKIKFLPTNIPERKWLIKEGIGDGTLNAIIKNFKYAGAINDTTSVKSVVSYLDNGEIKNVIFDKNLHKIVD